MRVIDATAMICYDDGSELILDPNAILDSCAVFWISGLHGGKTAILAESCLILSDSSGNIFHGSIKKTDLHLTDGLSVVLEHRL